MIRTSVKQRRAYFFHLSPNIYIEITLKLLYTFRFLFSNELSLVSEPNWSEGKKNHHLENNKFFFARKKKLESSKFRIIDDNRRSRNCPQVLSNRRHVVSFGTVVYVRPPWNGYARAIREHIERPLDRGNDYCAGL